MFNKSFNKTNSRGGRWPGFPKDERLEVGLAKDENTKVLDLEIDTGTALYEWYAVPGIDGRHGGVVTYFQPFFDFSFNWLRLGDMYESKADEHKLLALYLYSAYKASNSLDGVRRNIEFLMLAQKSGEDSYYALVRNGFSLGLTSSHYLSILKKITTTAIKDILVNSVPEEELIRDANYTTLDSITFLSDFISAVAELVNKYPQLEVLVGDSVFHTSGVLTASRSQDGRLRLSYTPRSVTVGSPRYGEDAYKSVLVNVVESIDALPEWVDVKAINAMSPVAAKIYELRQDPDFVSGLLTSMQLGYRAVNNYVNTYAQAQGAALFAVGSDPIDKGVSLSDLETSSEFSASKDGQSLDDLVSESPETIENDSEQSASDKPSDIFNDLLGDLV